MKIIIADRADDDLLEIYSYLYRQSPAAADRLAGDIDRCLANLAAFPFSGSPRPRLGPDIRSVIALPYIIFHAVRRDHIAVLRVLHGSRNVDDELFR
jgi:toxin ParE1/3/4